jgi:putative lipoic acid-binding regulatory protein
MQDNLSEPSPGDQLEFPLVCHYKVICENREGMHFVVETVLQELGCTAPLLEGNKSANAKYVTFNLSLMVRSKDEMNLVDRELRSIEGVKMVL